MNGTIATGATIVLGGIAASLVALAPIASADTNPTPTGPQSTAAWQKNAPVSSNTGAPLGDAHGGTDPLTPYGTDPKVPVTQGYVNPNYDEGITSNGQVDLPF